MSKWPKTPPMTDASIWREVILPRWKREREEREAKAAATPAPEPPAREGVYGPMCRDPKICAGKGYCPRDPTCAD